MASAFSSATARPRSIAILIPTTSRMRPWKTPQETYLFNYTLKTFKETYSPQHNYYFYIGIDADDPIFSKVENQIFFAQYVARELKNTHIAFQTMKNVQKGHLTVMWNQLFDTALDDGNEYFYQTGDDIIFKTTGWIDACLSIMDRTDDIGMTGPVNNNNRILTQSFVSRKHKEIFGFYFPPSIINWCCDDWINWVYQPAHWFPLMRHYCQNAGGDPRYIINNDKGFTREIQQNTTRLRESTMAMATEHKTLIGKYISSRSYANRGAGGDGVTGAAAAAAAASSSRPSIVRDTTLLSLRADGTSPLDSRVTNTISAVVNNAHMWASMEEATSSVSGAEPPIIVEDAAAADSTPAPAPAPVPTPVPKQVMMMAGRGRSARPGMMFTQRR
jgi:hypothetical protein